MQDLSGFSGAAQEIVKAVSAGIGTLYRPRAIRKEADAEAYAIVVKAEAEAASKLVIDPSKLENELVRRAVERFKCELITQQVNLENIIEQALKIANQVDSSQEKNTHSDPIDPDWMTRFITHAKEISNSDLQKIWSEILARKAFSSSAVSLRSLDVLRNLSSEDADVFVRFLMIQAALGGCFYPIEASDLLSCGFHYLEFGRLADAGLIMAEKGPLDKIDNQLQQTWPTLQPIVTARSPDVRRIANRKVAISSKGGTVKLYAHLMTPEGGEIASIVPEANIPKELVKICFEACLKSFVSQGYDCSVDNEIPGDLRDQPLSEDSFKEFIKNENRRYEEWKRDHKNK